MTNSPIPRSPKNQAVRPTPATNTGNAQTPATTQPNTVPAQPPTSQSNHRDLDRSRASAAWNNIQAVKSLPFQAKYGSLARKMPTLIQVNGLGQTLAFLKAKESNDDRHKRMFDHLSDWVCGRLPANTGTTTEHLLKRVLNMDSQTYRFATAEALAFLQWIKRFAEAELGTED
jgi:CRISPR-associated protein Cmr5